MLIQNSLYPYPVLTSDHSDYQKQFSFKVEYNLQAKTSNNKSNLSVKINLNEPQIEDLILQGKAQIFLHVECPLTSQRLIKEVESNLINFEIDYDFMRSYVEVSCFVLVIEELISWTNTNIDFDVFGLGYTFPKLNIGNPLAVATSSVIELQENEDLNNVSSIIKIAQTNEEYMKIDYDSDIIFVYLPKMQYEKYVQYPDVFGEVLLSVVITPTLIYVLDAIVKTQGEDMSQLKWYQIIEHKIKLLNYSMNDVFREKINTIKLAQEILHNPLSRMFLELEGIVNEAN